MKRHKVYSLNDRKNSSEKIRADPMADILNEHIANPKLFIARRELRKRPGFHPSYTYKKMLDSVKVVSEHGNVEDIAALCFVLEKYLDGNPRVNNAKEAIAKAISSIASRGDQKKIIEYINDWYKKHLEANEWKLKANDETVVRPRLMKFSFRVRLFLEFLTNNLKQHLPVNIIEKLILGVLEITTKQLHSDITYLKDNYDKDTGSWVNYEDLVSRLSRFFEKSIKLLAAFPDSRENFERLKEISSKYTGCFPLALLASFGEPAREFLLSEYQSKNEALDESPVKDYYSLHIHISNAYLGLCYFKDEGLVPLYLTGLESSSSVEPSITALSTFRGNEDAAGGLRKTFLSLLDPDQFYFDRENLVVHLITELATNKNKDLGEDISQHHKEIIEMRKKLMAKQREDYGNDKGAYVRMIRANYYFLESLLIASNQITGKIKELVHSGRVEWRAPASRLLAEAGFIDDTNLLAIFEKENSRYGKTFIAFALAASSDKKIALVGLEELKSKYYYLRSKELKDELLDDLGLVIIASGIRSKEAIKALHYSEHSVNRPGGSND